MKYKIQQKAFTLVELLIAMGIVVIVGSVVTATLFGVLRGSSKSTTITIVKQNGDAAMSQMAKTIRNAKTLNYIYPCGSPSSPTTTSTLTVTAIDNTTTTFTCDSINSTVTTNGQTLFDTSAVALSPSMSCATMFTCSQDTISSSPVIQIRLSLTQKNQNAPVEKTSTISFQTSVEMRNVNR